MLFGISDQNTIYFCLFDRSDTVCSQKLLKMSYVKIAWDISWNKDLIIPSTPDNKPILT